MEGSEAVSRSGFGSVQIIMDLDPDPGGPKTYKSYGSGAGTLTTTVQPSFRYPDTYPLHRECLFI
jgi:hypothetical protein